MPVPMATQGGEWSGVASGAVSSRSGHPIIAPIRPCGWCSRPRFLGFCATLWSYQDPYQSQSRAAPLGRPVLPLGQPWHTRRAPCKRRATPCDERSSIVRRAVIAAGGGGGAGGGSARPAGGQAHACRASALGAAWWAEEADGPLSGGEGRCWGTWGGGAGDCLPHVNKRLHTPFCPLQGHVYTTMPIPPGGMQVCSIAQDCHPCQGVLHVPCIQLESVRICRMTGHPMTRAC